MAKLFGRLWAVAFLISSSISAVASLIPENRRPSWMGVADVVFAFSLVGISAVLFAVTNGRLSSEAHRRAMSIYQTLLQIPLALIVVFFLVGHSVDWTVLLIGFGWRIWLLATLAAHLAQAWETA